MVPGGRRLRFRHAWLAAVALLLGCGSSGGNGGGNPADAFVGGWTFDAGSIMPMCSGVNIGAIDLTGVGVALTKVDATHVQLVSTTGIMCDVTFTASGSTATVAANQSCTLTVQGTVVTINITSWTLMLSGDTIDSSMAGTATISIVSCAPTSTGTLTRPASDAGTD